MNEEVLSQSVAQSSTLSTNKMIKNTYMLLSMTLLWSAALAAISIAVNLPFMASMGCSLGAIGILWFIMPRVERSAKALPWVFAFTGLLGLGLGPILQHYLAVDPSIVTSALGLTAATFLGLSGYALVSKKDFSFMGGFLAAGVMVAFAASIIGVVASLVFNYPMPALMLAVSGAFALLSAGIILWQTSAIVNGGETNYVSATVTLYVAIYNLFTSLLHILGIMGDD